MIWCGNVSPFPSTTVKWFTRVYCFQWTLLIFFVREFPFLWKKCTVHIQAARCTALPLSPFQRNDIFAHLHLELNRSYNVFFAARISHKIPFLLSSWFSEKSRKHVEISPKSSVIFQISHHCSTEPYKLYRNHNPQLFNIYNIPYMYP